MLLVMVLLGVRDVIRNDRQDSRQIGFHLKFKFIELTRKLQIYFARVVKYDTVKHFVAFGSVLQIFRAIKGEKHAFLLKNGLSMLNLFINSGAVSQSSQIIDE